MDATGIAVIGIIATVIVALATLVVAYQTRLLAKSTADLGTQAERQVAEMETARRLEWAPYLTTDEVPVTMSPGDTEREVRVNVSNIGRGPALNCVLTRFGSGQWVMTGNFDLRAGQREDTWLMLKQADAPPEFLGQVDTGRTVLFCQDQFGACHMFDPPRPRQTSATAAGPRPWVDWYRARLNPQPESQSQGIT